MLQCPEIHPHANHCGSLKILFLFLSDIFNLFSSTCIKKSWRVGLISVMWYYIVKQYVDILKTIWWPISSFSRLDFLRLMSHYLNLSPAENISVASHIQMFSSSQLLFLLVFCWIRVQIQTKTLEVSRTIILS